MEKLRRKPSIETGFGVLNLKGVCPGLNHRFESLKVEWGGDGSLPCNPFGLVRFVAKKINRSENFWIS